MRSRWLLSTIGKRAYIADYFREASPEVYIVGSGRTGFTPGFTGCNETVLMPDIDSPGYLDAVRQLVADHRIEAILSFSDPDVAALSSIRDELTSNGVKCFFPGAEVANMGFDKLETARWAGANGVLVPRTYVDPLQALEETGLPLIRKPRFGSASVGVTLVSRQSDLLPPDHDPTQYIYQEFIAGEEVNIEICGDLDGRPMGICAWKKLLSRNGETELAVTQRRQDLIDFGLSLGNKARIAGPCDIDIIDRNGSLYLIEFNMRFGGGYPVSHLAGADFPGLLIRANRGERPALRSDYCGDIFMMKTLQPFGGPVSQADALFLLKSSYRD
jgi:carbamoyl-phosphate synthase large subunit